jgi:hypothetical protein
MENSLIQDLFDISFAVIFSIILVFYLFISIKDIKKDDIIYMKNYIIIITISLCIFIHIIGFASSYFSDDKEYKYDLKNYFFFQLTFDLLNICIIT